MGLLVWLLELLQSPARFPLAAVLLPTAGIPLSTAGRNRRLRRRGYFMHPLYRHAHPLLVWQRLVHKVKLVSGECRDNLPTVMVLKVHHYRLLVHHVKGVIERLADRHGVDPVHQGAVREQLPQRDILRNVCRAASCRLRL